MGFGTARTTALVTGAAGFLGSHLVDRLLDEGYEVVGIDNLMTGDLKNLERAGRDPHFHFQIADVRQPIPIYAELIFNLACPASPTHYQRDPYATFTTCVLGAHSIVQLMKAGASRLVHASTSEVYGDPTVHPQNEGYYGNVNPVGDRSCYDEGKRAAETLLNDSRRCWNVDVRIVRIFNTYGPRMAFDDGRVVSTFIHNALQGKPLTIHGDGNQTRSFCYVDDMIEGILNAGHCAALDHPVNLGNPDEYTVMALAEKVCELTDNRLSIVSLPRPNDDPRQRCPDITKAQELLAFTPGVSLKDGLQRTIDDFRMRLKLA